MAINKNDGTDYDDYWGIAKGPSADSRIKVEGRVCSTP